MKRRIIIAGMLLIVLGIAVAFYGFGPPGDRPRELVLYGNIDLRQVDLPFNDSERITSILVQEGDRVKAGQVVAHLDTRRLVPQVAEAEAQATAQQAVVDRLHHGSRPEEIAQARAALDSARADAANARLQYQRQRNLVRTFQGRATSRQDFDNARAAFDMAAARVVTARNVLDLAVIGPRKEDIAQAVAQLHADQARLALLRQQLADAALVAPVDAIVRSRLMEPGEMASPQKPVLALAVIDPKWVRAYVAEPDLGKIHPGEIASVTVDSFPNRSFPGWIGFISPVAEFTPKAVETTELRTSLVYEVRIFVNDPGDDLRLGMPATVSLPLASTDRHP